MVASLTAGRVVHRESIGQREHVRADWKVDAVNEISAEAARISKARHRERQVERHRNSDRDVDDSGLHPTRNNVHVAIQRLTAADESP